MKDEPKKSSKNVAALLNEVQEFDFKQTVGQPGTGKGGRGGGCNVTATAAATSMNARVKGMWVFVS